MPVRRKSTSSPRVKPGAARNKKKVLPKKVKYHKGQYVWFQKHGRKNDATVYKINTRNKWATVIYKWTDGEQFTDGAKFTELTPQREFEIGDKVKVDADGDGVWRNGEVEDFKKGAYIVFFRQDRRRLVGAFRPSSLRPR